jgi:hypothetical protein
MRRGEVFLRASSSYLNNTVKMTILLGFFDSTVLEVVGAYVAIDGFKGLFSPIYNDAY